MRRLEEDLEEDEEDGNDLEVDTKRVDNIWDDITTLGQVPIYETVLRDKKGREYKARGESEEDSYQNALEKYREAMGR